MTAALADPGPKPDLAWLPVARLAVDDRYQRSLHSRRSQKLIEHIAEHFNWSAFQALVATSQGEGWLIIDGQHRAEAARRRGETHVPAVLVKDADIAEQAAIFVQANIQRVAVSPFALYHAKLVSGDPEAEDLQTLCTVAGLVIPRQQPVGKKAKPGETAALGALQRLIRKYGVEKATTAARAVADAYREDSYWLRASLFTAVGSIVARAHDPEKTAADITAKLEKIDPADLFSRAAKARLEDGISEIEAISRALTRGLAFIGASPQSKPATPVKQQIAVMPIDEPQPRPKVEFRKPTEVPKKISGYEPSADAPVTPAMFSGAHRFAVLVRQGASMERLAGYFGISVDEARRRADALERH